MSSDDVIELGSSDEETEPAPKRSKPLPNAMVCIPRKLHEVTIKPTKPNPATLAKGLIGKAITVKKLPDTKTMIVNRTKYNGRPIQQPIKQHPSLMPKIAFNPFSEKIQKQDYMMKPMIIQNKPGITLLKTGTTKPILSKPTLLKTPIQVRNTRNLNLPPSITVKKTVSNRPIVLLNVKGKQQLNQRNNAVGEVLTVELDDDEAPAQKSNPQWYLRPEEQAESPALEEENNKEPDTPNLIEITIEDSPVKPVLNKRTHEVGAELAITIEDSPVKAVADKSELKSDTDSENDSGSGKVPHSKKKLEYPKEAENRKTVEIEIDPLVISANSYSPLQDDVNAISHIEDVKNSDKSTQEENKSTPPKEMKIEVQISNLSEFHPVYQSFINLCFQLENSDDMKKIVEKKIIGYYKQVPKEYTESEEFIDMVSSKMLSMKAGPEKMYLYIKDIVDELNMQRKLAKSQPVIKEPQSEEPAQIYGEESEYDSKRQRQIRKLEKTIKKLHRAIQKLEEQEVDFDDEDDSVYLLTERYKERMVRVYAKFCQLSNTKMPSEPRIQIDARPGQPSGPAKRLEKWINKKVPIGTPLPFPDFHDVLRCVRQANEEDKLNLNEVDIMEEARDLFIRCGKKLQRRRQENEWRLAASRIALDIDPAENNDELKRKLSENKKIAAHKETEIFNKYADRQNQLKLEAVEIGDKEADESPVESEEEEVNDETVSLENTEKRKEILKRLLHEKSKKTSDEKENQPSNEALNDNQIPEMMVEEQTGTKVETEEKEPEKNAEDDAKNNSEQSKNDQVTTEDATETLTLSDDSNELESDIDELHLLQKLHSGNEEHSSTVDTSDSDSQIAISDSLESSGDNKKKVSDDVISIENSSYSENEEDKIENTQVSNTDSVQFINEESIVNLDTADLNQDDADLNQNDVEENAPDTELTGGEVVHAPVQTNNGEYNESVEAILLASSEDDNSQGETTESVCVNLRDDLISIDEIFIGSINTETVVRKDKQPSLTTIENNSEKSEVTIDNYVKLPAKDTNIGEKLQGTESAESKIEAAQKTCETVLNEKSNELVEKMDVDEDEEKTETLENNASAT